MSSRIDEAPERIRRQVAVEGSPRLVPNILLVCGVLASLLYVVMNVVAAMQFKGYSSVTQVVSELSAIGAPSRPLWVRLGIVYGMLVVAFGFGVWVSAHGKRALRIVGALLVADGLIGLAWPPMHQRGAATSLTDLMHILFTMVAVPVMVAAMAVGATAFERRFRMYSIASIVVTLAFGGLTGLYGPRIPKNLPTPWVGVWERVSIAAFMLWMIVLAISLLRTRGKRPQPAPAPSDICSAGVRPAG